MKVKSLFIIIVLTGCLNLEERNIKKDIYILTSDSLKLFVETYGNKKDEACLLISGAGANSSFWSDRLCKNLVSNGFYVIKYDHRDFGYSSKLDFDKNPYDVLQLTNDAVTILDSLDIKETHVVGHSMGGFIVQLMGINFPDYLLSMTSASASTNSPLVPSLPNKTWEIFTDFNPTNNFEEDIDKFIIVWEYLNGTAAFSKEMAIDYTRNLYSRQEISGALGLTHVKAQASLTDRSELLKQVKVPTLIIHGEEDYLVDKYGGIQTAECIEGSKLILIPKMGHLPFNKEINKKFEDEIIDFIVSHKDN